MKEVKLKEKMPLIYKGNPTWYEEDTEFVVLDEKMMGHGKVFWKVAHKKYQKWVFDGWQNPQNFKD